MKIATQNLLFLFEEGVHTHSGQEWNYTKELVEARVEHFGQLFSEIDADILLLQEAASKNVIEKIIARTGIDYSYFMAIPDDNGVCNAVLYKQKDATCESIPATSSIPVFEEGDADTIGPRIWSRRDFVHLETPWKGERLHVIGIHIKANFLMPEKNAEGEAHPMTTQITVADGLIRSELFRFSQAKKVRELVDGFFISDPNAKVVVGGDFNAEEYDTIFRIIRGDIKKSSDSLDTVSEKISEDNRFSVPIKGRKRLVDHILVSKNLAPNIAGVDILNKIISNDKNIAPNPAVIGSDHASIVVELK